MPCRTSTCQFNISGGWLLSSKPSTRLGQVDKKDQKINIKHIWQAKTSLRHHRRSHINTDCFSRLTHKLVSTLWGWISFSLSEPSFLLLPVTRSSKLSGGCRAALLRLHLLRSQWKTDSLHYCWLLPPQRPDGCGTLITVICTLYRHQCEFSSTIKINTANFDVHIKHRLCWKVTQMWGKYMMLKRLQEEKTRLDIKINGDDQPYRI